MPTINYSLLTFNFYRDARNHEDDLVGTACNVLVHSALKVGKPPLHGIHAHATTPYLVGHEN